MASLLEDDITAIYISAGVIPFNFFMATFDRLVMALEGKPIVSVWNSPAKDERDYYSGSTLPFTGAGVIMVNLPRSQSSIYRQVLLGAKKATTKYVAVAEDDVLYSPEHFKFRPKDGHWGYNMNSWSIFTWGEPMFTQKPGGRRNLNGLICERQLLIDHLEERFKLWPGEVDIKTFGEPGKYDNQLGTTPYPSEPFYTNPPNIVFSHQTNLQFKGLGTRKRVGQIRAYDIPYWGKASEIRKLYEV